MAKANKDNKDKFQFNKGADRGFDISKGGKRKFDLSKDDDEDSAATVPVGKPASTPAAPLGKPEPSSSSTVPLSETPKAVHTVPLSDGGADMSIDSTSEPEGKSGKKWLGIVVAIAVVAIAVLAWWLWPSSGDSDSVAQAETGTEAAVEETGSDNTVHAGQPAEGQDEEPVGDQADEPVADDPAEETADEPAEETADEPVQSNPRVAQTQPVQSAAAPASVSGDIETEAYNVIRGDYGNGRERMEKLGSRYQEIQSRVNELYRQGNF